MTTELMTWTMRSVVAVCLWVAMNCPALLTAADSSGPQSPGASRREMQLADPDLVVELVAAEPAVSSPVAMAWDAAGRLFVVEMSDYPAAETGGRIRELIDRDGDGLYEAAVTFADGLKFPNSVLPWQGGLLVTSAPDILFLKDTDGDGQADERRVVLTGFGEGNQQLRVNGLHWGLDNWVYGANGRSGGAVRRPGDPPEQAVPISRHDFRFQPQTGAVAALAGMSQFGLARDDFRNRFLSWNTVPIRHVVIEEGDLSRNPWLTAGQSVAVITEAADTGRVYPVSAPPRTFNRERTDYFNASCGLTLLRGTGLGAAYAGNAFVAEPLTNLIHRKILTPQGATFVARRGEPDREFLASTDRWFHPVNLVTGPDGCLYIADFYREWVEHPQFVPPDLRNSVDFRTGNEHGRIWRVRHKDFTPESIGRGLAKLTPAELVAALRAPSAWKRDTAQRLLVERQEPSAVPALERLAETGDSPTAQVHALWTLSGLSALTARSINAALSDRAAEVREQGISLARQAGWSDAAWAGRLTALVQDPAPRVRFQAALAAGDLDHPLSLAALAVLARQGTDDEWERLAVLSGLGKTAWPFLQVLHREDRKLLNSPPAGTQVLLREVAALVGARQEVSEIAGLIQWLGQTTDAEDVGAAILLTGLGEGVARRQQSLEQVLAAPTDVMRTAAPRLDRILKHAETWVTSRSLDESQRLLGLALVLQARPAAASAALAVLLVPEESPALQAAAARGVGQAGDAQLAGLLLERWQTFRMNTRRELIAALVRKPSLATPLLESLESGTVSVTELDPLAREALRRVVAEDEKARVAELLKSAANSDRAAVVKKYRPALDLAAEAALGARVFARNCLTCHPFRGAGFRVGPDLSGIASRPKAALLDDVLNPSREVSPDFVNYVVVTKAGEVHTGLLVAETPTLVRLRGPQGLEQTLPWSDIGELSPNRQSLMPEGFEQTLSPQDVAHLLEFLHHPVALPNP